MYFSTPTLSKTSIVCPIVNTPNACWIQLVRDMFKIDIRYKPMRDRNAVDIGAFIKGAFKLADIVTFPTKTSSMVKKLQICISFCKAI